MRRTITRYRGFLALDENAPASVNRTVGARQRPPPGAQAPSQQPHPRSKAALCSARRGNMVSMMHRFDWVVRHSHGAADDPKRAALPRTEMQLDRPPHVRDRCLSAAPVDRVDNRGHCTVSVSNPIKGRAEILHLAGTALVVAKNKGLQ